VAIGILNTFGVVGCRLLNHTYMVWWFRVQIGLNLMVMVQIVRQNWSIAKNSCWASNATFVLVINNHCRSQRMHLNLLV
jgi:hypothetical protein